MRYGTRTIAAKKWTSQGHRPKSPMKYGYKYHYLFQAIQPSTGKTFEMYLPNMSGDCFKIFMTQFAQQHPGQMMIMDNAGCHHVKWEDENFPFPDVRIEYLSPYSPDFNPQERIFQEIRKPTKGKVYQDTDQIEVDIDCKLKFFWDNPNEVKSITAWDWII
jgi:transposase